MDLQVAVLIVHGTVTITALNIVLAQAICHEGEPGVSGDLAEPDVQLVVEGPGVEFPAGNVAHALLVADSFTTCTLVPVPVQVV